VSNAFARRARIWLIVANMSRTAGFSCSGQPRGTRPDCLGPRPSRRDDLREELEQIRISSASSSVLKPPEYGVGIAVGVRKWRNCAPLADAEHHSSVQLQSGLEKAPRLALSIFKCDLAVTAQRPRDRCHEFRFKCSAQG
jgi:hypothetical protein